MKKLLMLLTRACVLVSLVYENGTQETVEKVIRDFFPLYILMIVMLLLITFIPAISLWLPSIISTV